MSPATPSMPLALKTATVWELLSICGTSSGTAAWSGGGAAGAVWVG